MYCGLMNKNQGWESVIIEWAYAQRSRHSARIASRVNGGRLGFSASNFVNIKFAIKLQKDADFDRETQYLELIGA